MDPTRPIPGFHRPTRRAFTLIEMVLVIAIIVTFAAIALPRFDTSNERYRVELGMRKLIADIDFCRATSRATEAPTALRLNSETHAWDYVGLGETRETTFHLADEPLRVQLGTVDLLDPQRARTAVIAFDSRGNLLSSGTVEIRTRTQSRTLRLHAPTGALVLE